MFELRHPPGSQSLVKGFGLAGAQVAGAAGGWRLWGREGGGGGDAGVNGAVAGVLSLELRLFGAGGGQRGGGGGDGGDGGSPARERPRSAFDGNRGRVESPGRRQQSPRGSERQREVWRIAGLAA